MVTYAKPSCITTKRIIVLFAMYSMEFLLKFNTLVMTIQQQYLAKPKFLTSILHNQDELTIERENHFSKLHKLSQE